jgi:hypothetical protein
LATSLKATLEVIEGILKVAKDMENMVIPEPSLFEMNLER